MSGKLIVLEGIDGSGKATQTALLAERLQREGRDLRTLSFPDYDSPSSALVRMYLGGELGPMDAVNPYAVSSFYALDRYVSFLTKWGDYYAAGGLLLCDRYVTSNIIHQMVKFPAESWQDYIKWQSDYEYRLIGLPEPDLVVYLDMHPDATGRLVESRYDGDENKKDLHERDVGYQTRCREAALYAARPMGWQVVTCFDGELRPLPRETVAGEVYNIVNAKLQNTSLEAKHAGS